jgi:two-component system nitrogen regulation sensor histidine kinase NtrY
VSLRLCHESRAVLVASLGALPAMAVAAGLVLTGDYSGKVVWTSIGLVLLGWALGAWTLKQHVVRPLHGLASVLGALREGDFSVRGRGASNQDVLGQAILEANTLADILQRQQMRAVEATQLLRKVMDEMDAAVMAFDQTHQVKLANPAAERLLGAPVERLLGRKAAELRIATLLEGEVPRTESLCLAGGPGPWEIRRREFRQGGLPHVLLMVNNLERALREEERVAWQRLVRVLGHEINNSLAPIQSVAQSALSLMRRSPPPLDRDADVVEGLNVIARRSESLVRFMDGYAKLARLPPPTRTSLDLRGVLRRVAGLETRVPVLVEAGDPVVAQADQDQVEQALINLVKNAADASLGRGTPVQVELGRTREWVEIRVLDQGPGLGATRDLFVPFFTTKPEGTGIGLVLARQIAQAHGGTVTLTNRGDGPGCRAVFSLRAH